MPVEVVSYMLSVCDPERRLQFQMILQCAPFLKGIKTACIMNIEDRYCQELDKVLAGTDMEYRCLAADRGRRLILFYRRKKLAAYIMRNFWRATGIRAGILTERLTGCREESVGMPAATPVFLMRSELFWIIPSKM